MIVFHATRQYVYDEVDEDFGMFATLESAKNALDKLEDHVYEWKENKDKETGLSFYFRSFDEGYHDIQAYKVQE